MDQTVFELIRQKGLQVGMAVIVLKGHDTGRIYLICSIQANYVSLVDGLYRSVQEPKCKNVKHVKALGQALPSKTMAEILRLQPCQADLEIRKVINRFFEINREKERK